MDDSKKPKFDERKSLQRPAWTSGNLYSYLFKDKRVQHGLMPGSQMPNRQFIKSFVDWWNSR